MAAQIHHHNLHFLVVPLMSQSHLIPMTDFAKLLASHHRGATVTIITTPLNAARFQPLIDRATRGADKSAEMEKWLETERFEDRNKERGLVIKGWAPQVMILSHPAVGGFLTHCGWNSTLEGVCAGVPMITWPMFAEQFYNEKLITEVLRIGVRIGVEVGMQWGNEEEEEVVFVKREKVRKAIEEVMRDGEGGGERRRRARELAEMAKKAVEEGGSSYLNITLLIEDVIQHANQSNELKLEI